MSILIELKQKRAKLHEDQQQLLATATKEQRGLNADEELQFDTMEADFRSLSKQIEREEAIEKRAKELIEDRAHEDKKEDKKSTQEEYREAFKKYIRGGINNLTAGEKELLETQKRTQVTTTNSLGGYLVPQEWDGDIIKTLVTYGGMFEAARIKQSEHGGSYPVSTLNDTSNKSAIIAQGTADSKVNLTFGQITLGAYTYTTNLVKMSYEQVQDQDADLDLMQVLSERMFRGVNEHLTTGDGSGKPNGVVARSAAGKTAAAVAAVTVSELIDLQHSVDPLLRMSNKTYWMFNDTTLSALRKLQFGSSDNRPLWNYGNIQDGAPPQLLGKPYIINNDMADLGASAKPIVFGNFDRYLIRVVKGFEVKTLFERYADERSLGYFGFYRVDGNLLDTAAVKHLVCAAS